MSKTCNCAGRCNDKTCMVLPQGSTCADCQLLHHCKAFYGVSPENKHCDFFPRRFIKFAKVQTLHVVDPETLTRNAPAPGSTEAGALQHEGMT